MKRGRGMPFVLFVVCLVAAMPVAWGEDALPTVDLARPPNREVTLCHIPPGDPANARTIVVGESWGAFAVRAHLAHGDYLGECRAACAGVPSAVPKTGQTLCWGVGLYDAFPVDCAGTGQDGEYQTGVLVSPRFTDNLDGTVTDNLTGLRWLKNANCFGHQYWTDALTMSNTLSSGSCGLTDGSAAGDWRLPNIKELQSLIDYGQANPALTSGHPIVGVSTGYWSSTSVADPRYAWWVSLQSGFVYQGLRVFSDPGQMDAPGRAYVWPVRGGQ